MQQFKLWYAGLDEREQKIAQGAAALFVFIILIFGILKPLSNSVAIHKKKIESRQNSVSKWKEALPVIIANRGQVSGGGNKSLSFVVTSTTRAFRLRVSRVQEKGTDEIQVWFDNVSFNDFIGWVADIQKKHQVKIASVNIRSKDRDGLSSIDVKIQRG